MAYLPEYNVGYFYSINAGNGDAFEKIGKAIRGYVTRELQKPDLPPAVALAANASDYSGRYQPDSPRVEIAQFLERLLGIAHVRAEGGKLLLSTLNTRNELFVPVNATQFRVAPKKELPEPVATASLLAPNVEGQFIQIGDGTVTMKRIPAWFAIAEIFLVAWFALAVVAILLYAPFWILGGLSKKRRRPAERSIRLWPLLAVLSLLAVVLIFMLASDDLIVRMGNFTIWSLAFCLATISFGVASVASAIAVSRARKQEVRTSVLRFSVGVTIALLIAAAYLAYWGIIGLRPWA